MQTTLALTDPELLDTLWSQLDQRLPAFGDGLRVSIEQGILTLSGSASHSSDHWTVAEAARSVPGVRAVVDDINGDPTVCQTDRALAKHVIHALTVQGYLPERPMQVTIRNGMVLLDGNVPFDCQRRAAGACVRSVPGVQGVCNRLQLQSPSPAFGPEEPRDPPQPGPTSRPEASAL